MSASSQVNSFREKSEQSASTNHCLASNFVQRPPTTFVQDSLGGGTDWFSYSPDVSAGIWLDSTKSLAGEVADDAKAFGAIKTEKPNRFIVLFPADRELQCNSCANAKELIEANLAKRLKSDVTLTLRLDPSISTYEPSLPNAASQRSYLENSKLEVSSQKLNRRNVSVSVPPKTASGNDCGFTRQPSNLSFQEVRRQLEQNEIVKEIKEVFDAELSDVRKNSPNA